MGFIWNLYGFYIGFIMGFIWVLYDTYLFSQAGGSQGVNVNNSVGHTRSVLLQKRLRGLYVSNI
jgi:hypothetical protein